jgi:hypothetical protein
MNAESPKEQNLNLPKVLHFLHKEWQSFEVDKLKWELEKAELIAEINKLKSERSNQDAVKVNLLRRVKMLESSLRKHQKYRNMFDINVVLKSCLMKSCQNHRSQFKGKAIFLKPSRKPKIP